MKPMELISGAYDPKKTENKIYKNWEASGFFNPDNLKTKSGQKNYIVYMPLPNITGSLHIGHALDNTFQDILIRFKRMKGFKTLWFPGTDHAGISTQYVVEKELKKNGESRFNIGREKFVEKVWEWKNKYGNTIIDQLKKLGCSADWSRARFTMDEKYAKDVMEAFVHYHKKGLIYRGKRVVNWCVRCGTSLSELELEYEERKTKLWHIKYPILGEKEKFIVVATTRPETMLGDTALAVNPKDERYKKFIGKKVFLPIENREINVISDEAVDFEFGTGAVKVTPAHDITDFEISLRHKLEIIQVINEKGKMEERTKEFSGLKTDEARNKIVEKLKSLGLLEKEEDYSHNVSKCYRCGGIIEPIPSFQWFLKMNDLAKKAEKAVKSGEIKIRPENFEKTYFSWLSNIRDWTISRQIWWGHQLPVWQCKCQTESNSKLREEKQQDNFIVSIERPKQKCKICNSEYERISDVLDTWFSSALWPFAGLSSEEIKKYYPGNALITARDILNLWVARMIFSGLEFYNKVPFKDVLVHGTILTKEGKRMSKSLGTGVDPLVYIDKYGADATRFGVIWQATGQDIRWDETAITAGKKFCNKIWNAARFVISQNDNETEDFKTSGAKLIAKTEADKKIIEALQNTKKEVENNIEEFEFSRALHALYDFFWHNFCDEYIEKSKEQMKNDDISKNTKNILSSMLKESLKMLHPFLPFITEEIYQTINFKNKERYIMIESWD